MGRWQPLPGHLEPESRRLAERLRLLKDRTGLGLASLSRSTAYSRSSWQRYLNGHALPPWQAVAGLGRLAGDDIARLRALWELASRVRAECPGGAEAESGGGQGGGDNGGGPQGEGRRPEEQEGAADREAGACHGADGAGLRKRVPGWASGALVVAILLSVPGPVWSEVIEPATPWTLGLESVRSADGEGRCAGDSCDGLEPRARRCHLDGKELGSTSWRGRRIRLVHSARCRAVWAEVSPAGSTTGVSVSIRGGGMRWSGPGAARTGMLPVRDPTGSLACAVVGRRQVCVRSDGSHWIG